MLSASALWHARLLPPLWISGQSRCRHGQWEREVGLLPMAQQLVMLAAGSFATLVQGPVESGTLHGKGVEDPRCAHAQLCPSRRVRSWRHLIRLLVLAVSAVSVLLGGWARAVWHKSQLICCRCGCCAESASAELHNASHNRKCQLPSEACGYACMLILVSHRPPAPHHHHTHHHNSCQGVALNGCRRNLKKEKRARNEACARQYRKAPKSRFRGRGGGPSGAARDKQENADNEWLAQVFHTICVCSVSVNSCVHARCRAWGGPATHGRLAGPNVLAGEHGNGFTGTPAWQVCVPAAV